MIAEQLMTPLHDFVPQKVLPSEPVEVKPSTETTTTETHQDTEVGVWHNLLLLEFKPPCIFVYQQRPDFEYRF